MITASILHLFGRQKGVAADRQLLELLSRRQLKRRVESGLFLPELPGIRRLAGVAPDTPSRIVAASLYVGASGFVSGMAAAREHGVTCVPNDYIEIMIPDRRDPVLPAWVRCTRTMWRVTSDRRELADGRIVASPLRALFRCGATCSQVRFEKIAEQLWNRCLITPAEASSYLDSVRRQGRHGVGRFERWLEGAIERPRPSQSGLEVDLEAAVRQIGLPKPVRQHPLRLLDGSTIHVDLAWPDAQLGLEPGATWWHSGNDKVRADHGRDRACDEIGWRILRFDEVELRDLRSCAQQVAVIHRDRLRLQKFALQTTV